MQSTNTINSGGMYGTSKNLIVYLLCCDIVGKVLEGFSENVQVDDINKSVLVYQAVTAAAQNNAV